MCPMQKPLIIILGCTIAVTSPANHYALAQFGGGRDVEEQAEENQLSDEPKVMIALSLWILTLSEPDEPAGDEPSTNVAERAANLPPIVGSVSRVRELLGRMRVAGLLRSERELRMVTLDGQSVTAQIGRNQSRIVAMATDPRGGRTNSIQIEPTGLKIDARPQLDSEGNIQVSVEIVESNLEKSTDVLIAAPADRSPVFADVVTTRQFSTTARLKSGDAVLLQSDASVDDPSGDKTALIILGAAVVDESE